MPTIIDKLIAAGPPAAFVPFDLESVMFHCQICERAIKAKSGLIAHHGYTRPGHGWQTASCFGARWRPYEVASDALPPAIESLSAYRDRVQAAFDSANASPPPGLPVKPRGSYNTTPDRCALRPAGFDPFNRPGSYRPQSYESEFFTLQYQREQHIKAAAADLERLRKRLADWRAAESDVECATA